MTRLENTIGNTPLIRLQRLVPDNGSEIWLKMEGTNPAGSVKDRTALSMICRAEQRGEIAPGDLLIEATSGNTGIALAMVSATKGYRLRVLMPENMSQERQAVIRAYGAELKLVSREQGMEGARELVQEMAARNEGWVLDQFNNPDNPMGHYCTTGPEIWQQTQGQLTHFVSSMGTTGTIMGTGRYLKERKADVQIIGLQPDEDSYIPGIRRWSPAWQPAIYQPELVDRVMVINQQESEQMMRLLARREGLFCGVSSGGAVASALKIAQAIPGSRVVAITCDRGDRYLSDKLFAF